MRPQEAARTEHQQGAAKILILTRLPNQSIKIGDDIEIFITAVHGREVRVGVNAPKSVRVDRGEIRERIEQEKATR